MKLVQHINVRTVNATVIHTDILLQTVKIPYASLIDFAHSDEGENYKMI
jgi:hypothetical protein